MRYILLILAILLMSNVIVNDAVLRKSSSKISSIDTQGRDQIAMLDRGWSDIDASHFSFINANALGTDFIATDFFEVGDKLLIDQASRKFFWVVDVQSDHLVIAGGDTYTFTNTAINRIAFSRIYPIPEGWPSTGFFYANMALIMFPSGGTGASVNGTATAYFEVKDGVINVSYSTNTVISTSGNAVNHYVFAQVPSPLIVPSTAPSDQVVFPKIQTGYADNSDDFLVGIGSLIIFEGQVQLGGTFGQATYPWPQYVAIRMGPYADHKFGNASGSGNSTISISGNISYYFR